MIQSRTTSLLPTLIPVRLDESIITKLHVSCLQSELMVVKQLEGYEIWLFPQPQQNI